MNRLCDLAFENALDHRFMMKLSLQKNKNFCFFKSGKPFEES